MDGAQSDRPQARGPEERRRSPRFSPQDVDSLLGEVLDLSVTGVRIVHQGPMMLEEGEEFDILLLHRNRDVLLPVRVVRIEAAGTRRHELGLEITRQTPDLQQRILTMLPTDETDEHAAQAYRMREHPPT